MMKYIILFILSIQLVYAQENWENILLTYDYHFKGVEGIKKLTSPEGEEIINKVQNYISNPKNIKNLETPDGKKLLSNHQKYLNFLSSKKTLDDCQNNKDSKRKLDQSITLGILDTKTPNIERCRSEYLTSFKILGDFYNSVNNITSNELRPQLQDILYEKSILNTTEALLLSKMRYDQNFFKNGFDKKQASQIYRTICKKKIYCSEDLSLKIKNQIIETYNSNTNSLKKISNKQLLNNLNGSIEKMNNELKKIDLKPTEGALADTFNGGINFVIPYMIDSREADLKDEDAKSGFNNYLKTFLEETSSQDGLLMHTSSIRDKMGPLRTNDNQSNIDENTGFGSSSYQFISHEKIEEDDIEDAIDDMYESIDSQINLLQKQNLIKTATEHQMGKLNPNSLAYRHNDKKYQKRINQDLRYLVKTNPKAVSQLLATNPEYATLVCDILIDIDRVDKNLEGSEEAFLWGGAILGVAGLLTGGVAWLGAGLLSAATITTLGTVSTGLIIASTASSVTGGTIAVTQASHLKKELSELESGLLSGNNYVESSEQMRDFYTAYKDAFYEATINTSMSITGFGALAALNKLGKSGAILEGTTQTSLVITDKVIKDLGDIYKILAKDSKTLRLLENTSKKLGKDGQKDLDEFLGKLAFLPKDIQEKFIASLTVMGPNSEKLAEMIKKTKCK